MTEAVLAIDHPIIAPTGATPPVNAEASPQRQRSLARAAQHDILRRLAPPLRHDMVVHLQSLGMMAEALSARLERGTDQPGRPAGMVSKLNRLSRQAVATCVDVCTWMQPAEDDGVNLHEGVSECVRLLSTSLNFRGFDLRTELGDGEFDVSRFAPALPAAGAIFTLTDAAPRPGESWCAPSSPRRTASSPSNTSRCRKAPSPSCTSPARRRCPGPKCRRWPPANGVELLRNGQASSCACRARWSRHH
jgi:hypothetical protein